MFGGSIIISDSTSMCILLLATPMPGTRTIMLDTLIPITDIVIAMGMVMAMVMLGTNANPKQARLTGVRSFRFVHMMLSILFN